MAAAGRSPREVEPMARNGENNGCWVAAGVSHPCRDVEGLRFPARNVETLETVDICAMYPKIVR